MVDKIPNILENMYNISGIFLLLTFIWSKSADEIWLIFHEIMSVVIIIIIIIV